MASGAASTWLDEAVQKNSGDSCIINYISCGTGGRLWPPQRVRKGRPAVKIMDEAAWTSGREVAVIDRRTAVFKNGSHDIVPAEGLRPPPPPLRSYPAVSPPPSHCVLSRYACTVCAHDYTHRVIYIHVYSTGKSGFVPLLPPFKSSAPTPRPPSAHTYLS